MTLTELFQQVVSLSLMSSMLAIGLLLIKKLFWRKLSANWHYYIWFLLILRLLIPYTPPSSLSLFNIVPHYQQVLSLTQPITPVAEEQTSKTPAQDLPNQTNIISGISGNENDNQHSISPANSWFNWPTLAVFWVVGVTAVFCYILLINGLHINKINKLKVCGDEAVLNILENCKAKLEVNSKVTVVYDDSLKSPALFGLLRPKLMISPDIVNKLSPEELRYIFLHELSHLKRRDLPVNLIIMVIQVIYWFNPLIWYALHRMKQDCEMACDATALATLKPEERKKYGQTLIGLLQLLSEPFWALGTLGFVNKFNTRRIIMISTFKKTTLKWALAVLTLSLVVGCTSLNNPVNTTDNAQKQQNTPTTSQQNKDKSSSSTTDNDSTTPSQTAPSTSTTDSAKTLLLNMMQLAKQGKIINSDYAVKATNFGTLENMYGKADKNEYISAAKGQYATYQSRNVVFGFNKGMQIFEARCYDSQLKSLSLSKVKEIFGTPAHDVKAGGQEIIGYTAGAEYKIEMVFTEPTNNNPNPVMDHYNVLWPTGTVNMMADDPGRQW